MKPNKWMQLIPKLKDKNWKKWWGLIKETYKEHPEETQWIHLLSLGYVTHMLHHDKNAKKCKKI